MSPRDGSGGLGRHASREDQRSAPTHSLWYRPVSRTLHRGGGGTSLIQSRQPNHFKLRARTTTEIRYARGEGGCPGSGTPGQERGRSRGVLGSPRRPLLISNPSRKQSMGHIFGTHRGRRRPPSLGIRRGDGGSEGAWLRYSSSRMRSAAFRSADPRIPLGVGLLWKYSMLLFQN